MKNNLLIILIAWAMAMLSILGADAQTNAPDSTSGAAGNGAVRKDGTRTYTEEHPLVYEDMWDLWPYSFLNENGDPDGFNVELIRLMMDELHIPYTIKLKEKQDAFEDLRDGKSDLILGLSAGYHDAYGLYSENPVTLFTQSVASPKKNPVEITTFKDLSNHKVFVNDSSLCHHLMIDYGWGENAIPYSAVKLALLKVSTEGEGAVVWNTLSLKWLINKYHIENLQLTPINMPHGEYKFMSNNPVLLQRLDSVYSALDSSDKLAALRNKWFYPDRQETGIPSWVWWLAIGAGVLALVLSIYAIIYNIQGKRLTQSNNQRNKRLALILETSHVRIWTYEVATRLFYWHNENGQVAFTYTADEFAHRYRPEDFQKLTEALQGLSEKPLAKDGEKEEEVTLNIKARDTEDGDAEEKDFVIALSVLRRDKQGNATVILGTKRDVTEQRRRLRETEESIQRYKAVFHMPMQGNIRFGADGIIANINEKACQMFGCEREEILQEGVSYQDLLDLPDVDIDHANGYTCTRTFDFAHLPAEQRKVRACKRDKTLVCQIELLTYNDEEGRLMGLFAVCDDITGRNEKQDEKNRVEQQAQHANDTLQQYYTKIDAILQEGLFRLVSYSPDSHTLTLFSSVHRVQHSLTQTRCMTLVDEESQKKTMHIFDDLDKRLDKEIRLDLGTNLQPSGNYPLHLRFSFIPLHDKQGNVTEYFGLCQDITTQKATDHKLLKEAKKVQEVENTKTSFINNMVQEIRTPMDIIVEAAAELGKQQENDQSSSNNDKILSNSSHLLHLIDNILYLSRLEAHMIEVDKKPSDFVDTFNTYCAEDRAQNKDVRFITENPYEQLVVNIDGPKVGNVMERVIENAVQHTKQGFIRIRYDYIGRRLMISVEDTGDGISPKELKRLNSPETGNARTSSGLGIPICHELLKQMGGSLEINSEEGLGTTVWITLPCHATAIKRKKIV
ncbi:MAG: transporter substrate-binding domain-containing protein [Bacteroidaceae bacterium]|nr:transporter substrate-binding domain-containing protein [Bacteroidaceae bacterium]